MPKYITAPALRELIRTAPQSVSIIDVRDDDVYGGQIIGSKNFPSHKLREQLPDIISHTQGKEKVVFHCSLSQQRGPNASRVFENAIAASQTSRAHTPEVLILQDGFVNWEKSYGNDPQMTVNYDKDHWKHGFQG